MGMILLIALLVGGFGSLIALILTCIYVGCGKNGLRIDWSIYSFTLVALTLIFGWAIWCHGLTLENGPAPGGSWSSLTNVAFMLGASPGVGAIFGSIIVFYKRRTRK